MNLRVIQMFDADGKPHPLDPRSILGAVIARLEAMGLLSNHRA